MASHKQRHRPAAGIEVVYDDERYSAIVVEVPPAITIKVFAKPHPDHLFSATSDGLWFACKRCPVGEHCLRWHTYARRCEADELPCDVLCEEATEQVAGIELALPDEHTSNAHRIYTITSDQVALIATIAAYLNNRQS